ncbi:MAG: amidohydrolase [Lachnospiraceae bacterium]|nr:amidohydrolase [Lachnospiraceae bacterium]
MGIVLKDILAALPKDGQDAVCRTNIYLQEDKIVGIGEMPKGFSQDRVMDGTDRLAIPGLVNAHTHSYMALLRNVADDLTFEDWLFKNIEPIEDKLEPEDAYWGACLAILEMMKSGTTCFSDMQMHIHQTSKAAAESGMRAVISRGLVGSGDNEAGQIRLKEAYEEKEAWKDCDRLTFFLGPHAPYSCDENFQRIVAGEAAKNHMGVHIHLSESRNEVENIRSQYGASPIALAKRAGLFDGLAVAAHCVHVDEDDLDILKECRVSVITNPASNMKLGNGFAPVPDMLEKGINVCIGTDGAASNNSLNMFHEMNLLGLIHKGAREKADCVSAREIFRMATINGAKALGMERQTGSIEIGKKADLAILNLRTPSMTPRNDLLAGLCYSANGSEVETLIIDGRIVMEDRKVLTLDEDRIYAEISRICKRLGIERF